MNRNIRIASLMGIPIIINLSWLITLTFITSLLAVRYYPGVFDEGSRYRDDTVIHWAMALASGIIFFVSIVLHELAHSFIAHKQGIPVKSITLFIFGGVSQITSEAKRPLYEFVMAIVGPLTSLLLGVAFFAAWWLLDSPGDSPLSEVLSWLFVMNILLAGFNMAPGFPLDGGRVLRSLIWGISGNFIRATRLTTQVGRGIGYALIFLGLLAVIGVFDFVDRWNGAWLIFLGMFLDSSAKLSWLQARDLDELSKHKAAEIMREEVYTAYSTDQVRYLRQRVGDHFMFFVSDEDDSVVGILTETQLADLSPERAETATAGELMIPTSSVPVVTPEEDAAVMLQRMEAESVWFLPVISEGRAVGVVGKEEIMRLLARSIFPGLRTRK